MVVDLETILVSGSSYFFYSVAVAVVLTALSAAVATIAAYGSFSYYSAVADSVATEAEMTVVADATMVATKSK